MAEPTRRLWVANEVEDDAAAEQRQRAARKAERRGRVRRWGQAYRAWYFSDGTGVSRGARALLMGATIFAYADGFFGLCILTWAAVGAGAAHSMGWTLGAWMVMLLVWCVVVGGVIAFHDER